MALRAASEKRREGLRRARRRPRVRCGGNGACRRMAGPSADEIAERERARPHGPGTGVSSHALTCSRREAASPHRVHVIGVVSLQTAKSRESAKSSHGAPTRARPRPFIPCQPSHSYHSLYSYQLH